MLVYRATNEILNGQRRGFARQGRPNSIYCEGEKGFKRVNMELHNVFTNLDIKQIKRGLNDEGVEFLFKISMSPQRGGCYGTINRILKHIIKAKLGRNSRHPF